MTRLRLGPPRTTTAFSLSPANAPVCATSGRTSHGSVPKGCDMIGRAAIHSCSLVLAHAPDLVRHGSKPARELAVDTDGLLASLTRSLRSYDDALAYAPIRR